MEATRVRVGSVFELVVAAAFLMATFAVGLLIVRELRTLRTASPPGVEETAPGMVPAGVPARALSVPVLLLLDGKEVRVGDDWIRIAGMLHPSAERGDPVAERSPLGERLTRFYEHAGTRFVLVFEPFERGGPPRVAAIYIQ